MTPVPHVRRFPQAAQTILNSDIREAHKHSPPGHASQHMLPDATPLRVHTPHRRRVLSPALPIAALKPAIDTCCCRMPAYA